MRATIQSPPGKKGKKGKKVREEESDIEDDRRAA
jgi:hypothetical protein